MCSEETQLWLLTPHRLQTKRSRDLRQLQVLSFSATNSSFSFTYSQLSSVRKPQPCGFLSLQQPNPALLLRKPDRIHFHNSWWDRSESNEANGRWFRCGFESSLPPLRKGSLLDDKACFLRWQRRHQIEREEEESVVPASWIFSVI